jgi:hypothetical protein
VEFASDVEKLRRLFDQFCGWKGEFAPHAMLGQLSRTERVRHAYLHMDPLDTVWRIKNRQRRVEVHIAKHLAPVVKKGRPAEAASG